MRAIDSILSRIRSGSGNASGISLGSGETITEEEVIELSGNFDQNTKVTYISFTERKITPDGARHDQVIEA